MAWNGTKTWAASDTLTAADLNTYVRDNTDALAQPFSCSLTKNPQSIPNVTTTTLTFTSAGNERWDPNNAHSTATNPTRITVPAGWAGKLDVSANGEWATGGVNTRRLLSIVMNGTTTVARQDQSTDSVSGDSTQSIFGTALCAAGDYFELTAYQASGGAMNLNVYNFTVTWRRT